MNIRASLDTIILYVRDVENLKHFYISVFGFSVLEEQEGVWVLLDAGQARIGLHRMGEPYLANLKPDHKNDNNVKLVFETDQDLNELRTALLGRHIPMREIKTFEGYSYWLCDGEDPESNMFQLKQRKIGLTVGQF
jgi:catechol-2,3-dioxygenase